MTHKNHSLLFFLVLLICAANAFAQTSLGPFDKQLRTDNPLREAINIAGKPVPAVVDHDKDGDLDIVLADYYNGTGFSFLRNDGTKSSPAFNYTKYYAENPFYQVSYALRAAPAFTDLDGDGDPDMLLGSEVGTLTCYLNSSASVSPYVLQNAAWNASTKTGNPFYGIDLGDYTKPVFVDYDNDGDKDVFVGTSYLPNYKSVWYYQNDGNNGFAQQSLTGINPFLDEVAPAVLDVDGDGKRDIIIGAADGSLHYYKAAAALTYVEQTGILNPWNGFNKGTFTVPLAADFDDDGDLDVIISAVHPEQNMFYYENKGGGIFEEKKGLSSPVGGLNVDQESSPFFIDLDNDNDPELVMSGYSNIKYFKKVSGIYEEQTNNPFNDILGSVMFFPSLVDLDGDGDKDLVGGQDNGPNGASIDYFKNSNGTFARADFLTGPFKDIAVDRGKTEFADIDGDGDFDMFISDFDSYNYVSKMRFFKNTGTATVPAFTEMTGVDNPLSSLAEMYELFPRLVDVDHDLDLDMIIGEGGNLVENDYGNKFMLYENTGTSTSPQFVYRGNLSDRGDNPLNPAPVFIDYDSDGDLDIFMGGRNGYLTYYKNSNPVPTLAFNSTGLTTNGNVKVVVAPQLALTDGDNDFITRASVSIIKYQKGKQNLSIDVSATISASFDANTGVLTLTGKETVGAYQALLRTLSFTYTEVPTSDLIVTFEARVADADATNPAVVQMSVLVTAPVVQPPPVDPPPVNEEVHVYNAVAPNSSGNNHFMRIENLPLSNSVSIFNRWGDKVYTVDNYDDDTQGKRFEGFTTNGKSLPSGTYFYKIEYQDSVKGNQTLTGYLTLIQ